MPSGKNLTDYEQEVSAWVKAKPFIAAAITFAIGLFIGAVFL